MRGRLARFAVLSGIALLVALALAPAASARRLSLGMEGADVRHLKEELAARGYLPASAVDSTFDQRTWHAVVAFQGWQRLTPDGVAGGQTRRVLRRAPRPQPSSTRDGIEVRMRAQVMLLVRDGQAVRTIHVSTGAGDSTPYGHFRIYSKQVMSWSRPFKTGMPYAQYFHGGYALHESPSVPPYPASHGCVRIPAEESEVVWRHGRIGQRVWVIANHTIVRRAQRVREARRVRERRRARAIMRAIRRLHPLV